MNRRRFLTQCAVLPLTSPAAWAQEPASQVTPLDSLETHRLRVVNRADGAISVSTDAGKTWNLLGRVLVPATTVIQGYIAAEYATPGTVAAIAVHGHRIRVSAEDASLHAPLILSLDPKEYAGKAVNKGYGGHRPGSAGIYTGIAAGMTLFRELAPQVGSPVLREDADTGKLTPISSRLVPDGTGSEIFLIPVRVPADSLTEIVFPNTAGGVVRGTFASGRAADLTQVIKPVRGVGRFDGTAYTGVGQLNTAHTGVITVCTAPVDGALPEGVGKERRGGFQISPAWHNSRCEEAGAPMVMTVGEYGTPRHRDREGIAPLFRDAVSLGDTQVDVSIDGGDWEPMPRLVGLHLDAFTAPALNKVWAATGARRTATVGVTAFRLRLPNLTATRLQAIADAATGDYRDARYAAAKGGAFAIVSGTVSVTPRSDSTGRTASWARLVIEGKPQGFTNVAPFTLSWNTRTVPDGEYLIEAETMDAGGSLVVRDTKRVFVRNTAA